MTSSWEELLKDRLQLYGHRNWVAIADSAYPAQSRQGIETVAAREEQTNVLGKAIALLRECQHIKPVIYTDEELRFVAEEDAPGISSYREKLNGLLAGFDVCVLPHEEIISRLDRAVISFACSLSKPTCAFHIRRCSWSWSAGIGMARPRSGFGTQCDKRSVLEGKNDKRGKAHSLECGFAVRPTPQQFKQAFDERTPCSPIVHSCRS